MPKYKIKNLRPTGISISMDGRVYAFAPFEEKIIEVGKDLKVAYSDIVFEKVKEKKKR